MHPIKAAADLGAKFRTLALDMGNMPLDGGQADTLFPLLSANLAELSLDRAQDFDDEIVGLVGHGRHTIARIS